MIEEFLKGNIRSGMVAIVGPSGAGKSTLVHLIPRFYNIGEGAVYLDGHDAQGVTVESLRRQIGISSPRHFSFFPSHGTSSAVKGSGLSSIPTSTRRRVSHSPGAISTSSSRPRRASR